MKRFLFATLLMASSGLGHSQDIYKCASAEGLVYRDTPCATDQLEQRLIAASRNVDWEASQPERSVQTSNHHRPGLPLSATRLTVGMTDTQVLNLTSWGRPVQIVRSKAARTFKEEWVYNRAGDESRLYFENGRLASREDMSVPPAARLTEARASFDVTR